MRSAALRTAHAQVRGSSWGRVLTQARKVDRPGRYLISSLRRAPTARAYRVRGTSARVMIRHGSSDPRMFDEIFVAGVYEPPAEAAAALARIPSAPRVLDLGANVGLFSAWARTRWPGAQITALEPDPENFKLLERCAALDTSGDPWHLVPAAAAAAPGAMRFVGGAGSESHEAHPDELSHSTEVRAVDVFEHLSGTDLVKMDIEGGEWAILADDRLREAAACAIVLEHHGRLCPEFPPRNTAAAMLQDAGFSTRASGEDVNGVGMLWAWR